MKAALDTLREHVASRPSARSRTRHGLAPWELRYTLEATDAADVASLRPRIATLLKTGDFELHPLFDGAAEPDLARFQLLAFSLLDRRSLPRAALFEIGYELTEALALISAEPDLGADHFIEPEPPPDAGAAPEAARDLDFRCWVDGLPPANRRWAVDAMRIPEAWALAPGRGAGVLVAQPDTGIAAHAALDGATLRLDLAADLVDGGPGATDPLLASAGNPGHGTGTASVLIGNGSSGVFGPAPAVSLVPIRCIESVAVFDQSRVAKALDHARRIGAHVITMSLGGVPSRALEAVLERAVEEGAIVLAAAGNCVRLVVYPARYRRCIAVAGVNLEDRPWRGSSHGAEVDICAPGEFVWRALRRTPADPDKAEVSSGQGTSFAVALTAGAAALWVAHHGRDNLLAESNRRGVTVQALFRAALATTARTPAGWDQGAFGPGIVDAERLLQLAPSEIPVVTAEMADGTAEAAAMARLVAMALESAAVASAQGLDLRRYGLEIAALAFDAARLQGRPSEAAETAGRRPTRRLSPRLAAALATAVAGPPAAAAAPETPTSPDAERNAGLGGPKVNTPAASGAGGPGRSASAYLRILGLSMAGSSPALESAVGGAIEAARVLRPSIPQLLTQLERRFAARDRGREPPDWKTLSLRTQVIEDAERALEKATRDPAGARLDRRDVFAFEALVRTNGRPSLVVRNGTYDPQDPEIDQYWADVLATAGSRIPTIIRSVGRVDLDGEHVGSGFVVAPGLMLTNRHVLEALVEDPSGRSGWDFAGLVEVDFNAELGAKSRLAFRITGVAFAGPTQIGDRVDVRKLDLALLTVDESNREGASLPVSLPLVSNSPAAQGRRDVAVVGYPGRPGGMPRAEDGRVDPEVLAALERIFRYRYGVKRLALGRIDRRLGAVPQDAQPPWALGHDATTLGGNSGSAVAALQGTEPEGLLAILAVHMGGQWLAQNYAHVLTAVPALHGATSISQAAAFRWVEL